MIVMIVEFHSHRCAVRSLIRTQRCGSKTCQKIGTLDTVSLTPLHRLKIVVFFVCLYVCLFACLAPQVLDCTSIILFQIFENTSYFSASEQYVRGNLLKKLSHIRLINLLP